MWHFVHLVKKPTTLSDINRLPGFADDEYDVYVVPAHGLTDAAAELLLETSSARPGNTVLVWYVSYMAPMLVDDINRTLTALRQRKEVAADFADMLRSAVAATKDPSKMH